MFKIAARKILLTISFSILSAEAVGVSVPGQPLKIPPPLSEVNTEVADAQAKFETAKKMFNPWYGGPLLTPSPHNLPPGLFNTQPYLFFTWNYGHFTEARKSESIPTLFTVNTQIPLQIGLLKWLDCEVNIQGFYNHQSGKSSVNFGDTAFELGFQLLREKAYQPALRLTVTESFPTGKYQHLDAHKNGIDGVGKGAYSTIFTLAAGKVVWWLSTHPMAFRASFSYTASTSPTVKDFNVYGGGYETDGTVKIGNSLAADLGIEYSFTKYWVFAIDLVYNYQSQSTFSGHPGVNLNGTPASVGAPSNDLFSVAPALEYNPSPNMGFLGGVWVSVTGRNTSNFASLVLTMFYSW